jgi:hypothetical protein
MTQPRIEEAKTGRPPRIWGAGRSFIRREWALLVSLVTMELFLVFGGRWLGDLSQPVWFALMMIWLFRRANVI